VAKDDQGKPYSVRYEAVNAMLLNEFLKEHQTVEEQGTALKSEEATITELEATVAKLKATLDKVSARLIAKQL